MAYGSTTVTTTATLIITHNVDRKSLMVLNSSASVLVYIGPDENVTTATGLPLYQMQSRDFARFIGESYRGPIYGITASNSSDVRYWETI